MFTVHGFYIITYGLGIYILNLLIGFLSPRIDPEFASEDDDDDDVAPLPTQTDQEFKPFIRRLPEFKFWYVFYVFIYIFVDFCVVVFFFLLVFKTKKPKKKSKSFASFLSCYYSANLFFEIQNHHI